MTARKGCGNPHDAAATLPKLPGKHPDLISEPYRKTAFHARKAVFSLEKHQQITE